MRLQDKVALVTGVENEGIGQATAILFPEDRARVVVTDTTVVRSERSFHRK